MKMTNIIIGLIVLGCLIFYLTNRKNTQVSNQTDNYISQSGDTVKIHTLAENPFQDLRSMAFSVTPEQLQLKMPTDKTKVFGVIMDRDLGDVVITLISYETGDASLYLSSGGGVIGGGQHENVSSASKEFILKAQNHLDRASKTNTTILPDNNCINFYFLTNKGKFVSQETMHNIENSSSPLLNLFEEGNKVISELRLTTEKK